MQKRFKRFVINLITLFLFFACLVLLCQQSFAQKADTTITPPAKKRTNIFQSALNAITKSKQDTAKQALRLTSQSQKQYLPFDGKGIRHIIVKKFGFEKSFTDTSKGISYFGTRILNYLHRNSREWVIQNNLFIKEKTRLNPFVVADNERYLRSLDFIQDARIIVNYVPNEPDSVDIVVFTKDLFSITAELNDFSTNKIKVMVGDANVLGLGQRLEVTGLMEKQRDPKFAYQVLYTQNSMANTFINGTIAYTQINNNLSDGHTDEHGIYLQLDRPLYSQYARFAGAVLLGLNQSSNNYLKPDSFFYKYRYNTIDAWVGYNLSAKKLLENNRMRDRKFISLRYLKTNFTQTPFQIGNTYNQRFNDRQGLLTQFTFFRQDFYKTNYIYGFGTTEDVPYGYNIALTTGWYQQSNLKRAYVGVDANSYRVTGKGDFLQYFLRTGGFLHQKKLEDANILLGTSIFSRLFLYKNLKVRQYIRLSYTQQFTRTAYDQLKINNPFGLRYFGSDSVVGDKRLSLHSETFFFMKYKIFGFQFAPFAFADASLLTPEKRSFLKSQFYSGLGAGIRTRNENLVFGTIELRGVYFPRKVQNVNSFKIELNTNINFRYSSSYVKPPDIIQVNTDYQNNIY